MSGGNLTPRGIPKRLFEMHKHPTTIVPLGGVMMKKHESGGISGDESDIGPMSPLSSTDQSPSSIDCNSSPEQKSIPSFPTPTHRTSKSKDDVTSPFSTLRKITHSARYSPRCRLFDPISEMQQEELVSKIDRIVYETPEKVDSIDHSMNSITTENHVKRLNPCFELISPHSKLNRDTILLPKLHRRKSNTVQDKNLSPESTKNTLKRPPNDSLEKSFTKLFKSDEYTSIPKARAALFKETTDNVESQLKNFSLTTQMFYHSNNTVNKPTPMSMNKINVEQVKSKKNLPSRNPKHTTKRTKNGTINAGVSHKIKKPKLKPSTLYTKHESTHNDSKNLNEKENSPIERESKKFKGFSQLQGILKKIHKNKKSDTAISETCHAVSKNPEENSTQDPKSLLSFDTTDLIFDEPEEIILEKSKVNDLLKMLENDWADENENNESVSNSKSDAQITSSPQKLKKQVTFDTLMSPASELSNMTLIMNLKDNHSIPLSRTMSNDEKNGQSKYYPIFNKGYSAPNSQQDLRKTKSLMKSYTKWQLSKFNDENDQYQLDAGQKKFGATQCHECQVVYQIGDPEDEHVHLNYHNSIRVLKFNGWKNECVVEDDPLSSSRIILVEPNDSKQCWTKVSEILNVVDQELGLVDMKLSCYYDKRVFLYIKDKNVVGVLVAEPIKAAYRMIPDLIDVDCCTAESSAAKCGINVVWTVVTHRRQGIATKLVDTLRKTYYYGYIMSLDDIAFSMPTPNGKMFAINYTKTKSFQVYN